jgi:phytoene desaturase
LPETYDVAIVGAGHNGLVAATSLARAGARVLVLERRGTVGGVATTEEISPGFRASPGASLCGLLRPEVIAELQLARHGLQFLPCEPAVVSLDGDRKPLRLWTDVRRSQSEIAAHSPKDAETYPRFLDFLGQFAKALDPLMLRAPPEVQSPAYADAWFLFRRALRLRRVGAVALQQLLRVPPMPVKDLVGEWFETELLRASLAADALLGTFQGPWSPGTAFGLVRHLMATTAGVGWRFVRGGMGALSDALARAAQEAGVTLRTRSEVSRITSDAGRATGVELASGEMVRAKVVVSNADPKRTFLRLVESAELSPEFLLQVRNFEMDGAVAGVSLALSGLPHLSGDAGEVPPHFRIARSLEYLERAYDDAKYGKVSEEPFLDVVVPSLVDPSLAPSGKHVMTALVQYAPYSLRNGGWEGERDRLGDRVVALLEQYMPGLQRLVVGRRVLTPADLETTFGLTEGHIFHGEMTLDQLYVLRPVPGWARYRTPVEGLYLCGSGAHPGGGVTGAPGYNAAREILKDWPRLGRA